MSSKIIYYEIKFKRIFKKAIDRMFDSKHGVSTEMMIGRLHEHGIRSIPLKENDIDERFVPMGFIPYDEILQINEPKVHIFIKKSKEDNTGESTQVIIGPFGSNTYDSILKIIEILPK